MGDANVFTIPSGVPFLPTLADALLSGALVPREPDEALSEATIYLPTRRAGRALAQILADGSAGRAILLPRIVPLGEAGEERPPGLGGPGLPPIPALERRLVLTQLVQAWARAVGVAEAGIDRGAVVGSPADAVALAADLEALMDSLATEEVPWDALGEVVDIEHSRYFRVTLDFLRIAHERWPEILAERKASDPARHRHDAILAEAARLAAEPPRGPVIAAGSTGSIPATAALLAAIARSPRGAVVLDRKSVV